MIPAVFVIQVVEPTTLYCNTNVAAVDAQFKTALCCVIDVTVNAVGAVQGTIGAQPIVENCETVNPLVDVATFSVSHTDCTFHS